MKLCPVAVYSSQMCAVNVNIRKNVIFASSYKKEVSNSYFVLFDCICAAKPMEGSIFYVLSHVSLVRVFLNKTLLL